MIYTIPFNWDSFTESQLFNNHKSMKVAPIHTVIRCPGVKPSWNKKKPLPEKSVLNIVKLGLSPQTGSAQLTNQTEDLLILVTHIEVPANDRPFPQNCKTLAGPDSHLKFKYTSQIKV